MSEEVIGVMELPLDAEGFVRRQCPHCRREFKWHESPSQTVDAIEEEDYHCPYCSGRSADWLTDAQLEVVQKVAGHYAESQVHDMFKGLERQSSEFVKIEAGPAPIEPRTALPDEPNDMRRVDFKCHSDEPVKVLDEWSEPVHCLTCGAIS